MLAWAEPVRTTVKNGDTGTIDTLRRHGFEHDAAAPSIRWNSRSLDAIDEPSIPDGYRLATMAEYDGFASRATARRFGVCAVAIHGRGL